MSSTHEFSNAQIIEFAANVEQRGVKLYTEAASKIKQEATKNILLHLAEQEKNHEVLFRQLYNDIVGNHKAIPLDMDDEAAGYLSALTEADIFPSDDQAFVEQIHTLKDVIRVGMQAEKNSILFYLELSHYTWDAQSQQMLKEIIQEEKKHLVQLKELGNLIEERDVYY